MNKIMLVPYVIEDGEPIFFVGKRPHALIPDYIDANVLWQFPTGKIGDNHKEEGIVEGALRELKEELGVKEYRNFINNSYSFEWQAGDRNVKEFVFAVELKNRNIDLLEEEFEDFLFANRDEVKNLLYFENHKNFLETIYNDIKSDNYAKVFVFCGPSGSGKETILGHALEQTGLERARTVTSRNKKEGENEKGRIFVSREDFQRMEKAGEFMETNYFADNYYGSLKSEITSRIECGRSVLIELDLNGLEAINKIFSFVVSIFIKVDPNELTDRIRARGRDNEEEIQKRLEISRQELQKAKICDFIVDNKNGMLDDAIKKIVKIISDEKGIRNEKQQER